MWAALSASCIRDINEGSGRSRWRRICAGTVSTCIALNGSWNDLEEQIGKGRPVIAALKPSGQSELHYIVIDGIDGAHGLVTMNDPAERKLLTRERAGFEREWSAAQNWMLLALPARAAR